MKYHLEEIKNLIHDIREEYNVSLKSNYSDYCDYDIYQTPANYECNTSASTGANTNATDAQHYKQEEYKNKNEKNGLTPPFFSSSNKYKTFDQIDREEADKAFEIASRRFLANEEE